MNEKISSTTTTTKPLPSARIFQCSLVLEDTDNYVQFIRIRNPIITVILSESDSYHEPFTNLLQFLTLRYGDSYIRFRVDYNGNRSVMLVNDKYEVPFSFQKRLKYSTLICRIKRIFEIKVPFRPLVHQQRLIEFYQQYHPKKMLFNWALGSGKTRGALKVVGVECPRRCTVVCTNTMIEYWVQETKAEDQKCENPTLFEVIGYTEFKRQVEDSGTLSLRDSFVILDEGHYFRNITESMKLPLTALLNAEQFILLTGTAIVNDPDETAFLSILFSGKNRILSVKKLRDDVMDRIVSYHNPEDDPSLQKYFPTCSEQYIRVPMTWPQTLEYMMYRKSTGVLGGYKIKHGKLNSYNSTTRSISNIPFYILDDRNIQNSEAPKLREIVNMVSKPNTIYPLVVFSHFKDMGVHAIKSALDSRLSEKTKPNGKKYIIKLLTGDTPASDRQKLIDNYNKNHIDILLLTEAAQLGINLLASGSLHICEPHKNSQTENQTKKRVSRYKSHMKCDHKHVNVFKYLSVFPKTISEDEKEQLQTLFAKQWLNMDDPSQLDIIVYEELKKQIEQDEHGECIDEKMEANNMRKQELLEPYLNAIKQASIEYHGFKSSEEKRFIEKKNHAENQKRKTTQKTKKERLE